MVGWAILMALFLYLFGVLPDPWRGLAALLLIVSFAGFIACLMDIFLKITIRDVKRKWDDE